MASKSASPAPATGNGSSQDPLPRALPAALQEISVDEDYANDTDSAFGAEISSYSTSLVSSVLENSYEYGRRYHAYKGSDYVRPNDEAEKDRLDMNHQILRIVMHGKLFEAPVPQNVQRVLDVGCGTGLWAIEFADDHPSAEVLGVDLQPIQPTLVPPNLKFEIDDVEDEFPHTKPFDYIHCRYMAYSIKDWPRLVSQIYKHTAPNGIAEFMDYDLTYHCDDGSMDNTTLAQWGADLPRAGRLLGRDPCPGINLEKWVREAGFTQIVHKEYIMPLGPWPKDKHLKLLGAYNHMMVSQGVEAFTLRLFIKVLGWSHEEVQVLLAKVRRDLERKGIHIYTKVHAVWGVKEE
ncbi:hypothetical protein FQN53_008614 [Emmonsiellopsis sp. PD_33]|nr:hypothetical protein FQN53_008614 [Emmonsiellopsis sp. PD_33]